jgi:cytochrome b pre-mRNA-processing protein 3
VLSRLRKPPPPPPPVQTLYLALMARARAPAFFEEWSVPDTIDGRFDLVALHAFLLFDALRGYGPAAAEMGSKLADAIFTGFDEALRELGISDFGMSRRIRNMADAFYGRIDSYGCASSPGEMAAALQRNLYRGNAATGREAEGIASYMISARAALRQALTELLEGKPDFGPVPHLDQS